jgi:hypothetical protein
MTYVLFLAGGFAQAPPETSARPEFKLWVRWLHIANKSMQMLHQRLHDFAQTRIGGFFENFHAPDR